MPGKAANERGASNERLRPNDTAPDAGDFIDEAIAVWQPMAKRRLTREDGRQIAGNMAGFFRILQEWDQAERKAKKTAKCKRPEGTVLAPAPTL